jgi:hypothetical protein
MLLAPVEGVPRAFGLDEEDFAMVNDKTRWGVPGVPPEDGWPVL